MNVFTNRKSSYMLNSHCKYQNNATGLEMASKKWKLFLSGKVYLVIL